jgi:hypothetical protein
LMLGGGISNQEVAYGIKFKPTHATGGGYPFGVG